MRAAGGDAIILMSPSAQRLYEPAVTPSGLLHLGPNALFIGALPRLSRHAHGRVALLVSLHGELRLRASNEEWHRCRSAVVPAGCVHEVDAVDGPVAVCYPSNPELTPPVLGRLLRQRQEHAGCLLGTVDAPALLRSLHEGHDMSVTDGLHELLNQSALHAARVPLDARLARILERLAAQPQESLPLADLAQAERLSASHVMHLCAAQLGVPLRRWRMACRLEAAIRLGTQGANLTAAAHAAGFSDSQHLSHAFRSHFGLSPTALLGLVDRVSVSAVPDRARG